jgi:hypothetical protein
LISSLPAFLRFAHIRSTLAVIALIGAATFLVLLPTCRLGIPSGHDFEFHMNSWMEVASQWRLGIWYPRWAAGANFAYGEPRFIFYPPVSWLLGAALGIVLPWTLVPGVYCWIVLTSAGLSMMALARRWLPRREALFAAMFYAVNPYHLIIVYWRSAYAELLAGIWMPLLLLCILRLSEACSAEQAAAKSSGSGAGSELKQAWLLRPTGSVLRRAMLLAFVLATFWLSNVPAAVMANYSAALLILILVFTRRPRRLLFYSGLAFAFSLALAAFYLLPVSWEKPWVNIQALFDPVVRPDLNFLFTRTSDTDHNRFNMLVSLVAALEIAIYGALAWLSRRQRRQIESLWLPVFAWGLAAALLTGSFTSMFWRWLPLLRYVQIPWRWLLCLNTALALLLSLAVRRISIRLLMCTLMLSALAGVWVYVLPPWWAQAGDIVGMRDNLEKGFGYESVSEYSPLNSSMDRVNHMGAKVTVAGSPAAISITRWSPEVKEFIVEVKRTADAYLRLFDYPAWRVRVNDREVKSLSNPDTGQLGVPLAPSLNRVQVRFVRTWDRTAGWVISTAAALLAAVLLTTCRRRGSRV